MNISYDNTDKGVITVATYHDTDGSPMSSRIPGYLTEGDVKAHLAWLRANDRSKLPLLETAKQKMKAILRVVE